MDAATSRGTLNRHVGLNKAITRHVVAPVAEGLSMHLSRLTQAKQTVWMRVQTSEKMPGVALECPFSVVRWRTVVKDINTQYVSAKCRSRRVVQNCGFKDRRAVRITRTLQRLDDIQQEQNEATVSKRDFAVEINALLVGNISEVST